jgi:DNA-binding NarL/FixJ family response regulator
LHQPRVLRDTEIMMPARVVMFVSPDPGLRDAYLTDLRRLNLLSVWLDTADDAPKLLAQYHVAAIIVHATVEQEWHLPAKLIAAAGSTPVLILRSGVANTARQIERAFEMGCAGVIAEPCTAGTLASLVRRSISGERGILWPNSLAAEVG